MSFILGLEYKLIIGNVEILSQKNLESFICILNLKGDLMFNLLKIFKMRKKLRIKERLVLFCKNYAQNFKKS